MLSIGPDGYTGFLLALASGFFGATFFMLARLQGDLAKTSELDMRDLWSWPIIFLRCSVGIGAASILYFFFESRLFESSLWPNLQMLGFSPLGPTPSDASSVVQTLNATENPVSSQHGLLKVAQQQNTDAMPPMIPNKDTALLIVWSFLAGYSQTLVPNILVASEEKSNTVVGSSNSH